MSGRYIAQNVGEHIVKILDTKTKKFVINPKTQKDMVFTNRVAVAAKILELTGETPEKKPRAKRKPAEPEMTPRQAGMARAREALARKRQMAKAEAQGVAA